MSSCRTGANAEQVWRREGSYPICAGASMETAPLGHCQPQINEFPVLLHLQKAIIISYSHSFPYFHWLWMICHFMMCPLTLLSCCLFSTDSKGLSNPSEVEALREKVYASLEAYCKHKYPEQPGRWVASILRCAGPGLCLGVFLAVHSMHGRKSWPGVVFLACAAF